MPSSCPWAAAADLRRGLCHQEPAPRGQGLRCAGRGLPQHVPQLHEHKYQTLKNVATFADGIQVKTPGELTYQLCEEYVDDIVTVSEDETAAAILSLMENQKLVAEGAGAVPVAAACSTSCPSRQEGGVCHLRRQHRREHPQPRDHPRPGHERPQGQPDHCSGGQARPAPACGEIVSRCGSNVVSVLHDGSDPNMPISSCFLKLTLETRDAAQIEQIRAELTKEGFQLVSERV